MVALLGLAVACIWRFSARTEASEAQYQISQMAVSRTPFTAVSVPEGTSIVSQFSSENALERRPNDAVEMRLDRPGQIEVAQYQASESQHEDRRLMFRIALGLALAYVVFLGCWIWATRLRARRPRH